MKDIINPFPQGKIDNLSGRICKKNQIFNDYNNVIYI